MRHLVCLIVLLGAGSFHAVAQQQTAGARREGASAPTRSSAFSSTIQGRAFTSVNQPMPDATMRLRDARYGRIIDTQVTDKSGRFEFRDVDPGSYVAEIVGPDRTSVLAASEIVHVNAGDVVSTIVRMPTRILPFAGFIGPMTTPSAAAIVAEAAATAVLVVAAPGMLGGPTCPLR
jgi:hypothetical protein